MKEIKLTQGKVALVDDEDFDYLNQFKWYALKNRNTYYAQRCITINKKETVLKMHRLIMNTPAGIEVDHIDHNGLNNQKSNLRNCTFQENRKNRTAWGKSKFLGVTFVNGKYLSQIKIGGKSIRIGLFESEIEAAIAYNRKAVMIHGRFANRNIIENNESMTKIIKKI